VAFRIKAAVRAERDPRAASTRVLPHDEARRELLRPGAPGDVATRIVADLDNLLRFARAGFLLISGLAISLVGLIAIIFIAPATWVIVV
jgi:hypothetical protein